jgi:TolA-binding protein
MMNKTALAFPIILILAGCETMSYQLTTPADRASMSQDQLIAQENQRRLSGRLETLEMQIGQISRDLETLRSQLDSRCAAIEQKSEADKREMVARLSGELDKLMKQAATARPAAAPSSRGIEHTVQPGETLFIISKAYGVSAKTIVDLNKLTNPDRLSVGQKLFIPQ